MSQILKSSSVFFSFFLMFFVLFSFLFQLFVVFLFCYFFFFLRLVILCVVFQCFFEFIFYKNTKNTRCFYNWGSCKNTEIQVRQIVSPGSITDRQTIFGRNLENKQKHICRLSGHQCCQAISRKILETQIVIRKATYNSSNNQ